MSETTPTTQRRYWARRLIDKARGAVVPSYGSIEWLMLSEGDPRKVAACVIAAESWAGDGDDIDDRLRRELDDRLRADKRVEDADYQAVAAAHRERQRPPGKSFSERRAAQLAAVEPRPGDYPGGSAGTPGGEPA